MTRVRAGIVWSTSAPVAAGRGQLGLARAGGLDSFWAVDHLISPFPKSVWQPDFTFLARKTSTPDEAYDFATMLGHLAGKAGKMQLGVGVTDPHRRHPALLAQTFLTLSHLTKRAPILAIGAGERENLEPYGVAADQPVSRVEEALQVVRACLDATGPVDFDGRFFQLDNAIMDLLPPSPERAPRLWLGANGPRMLALTGKYADGWYPWELVPPSEYRRRLDIVRKSAITAGRDPDGIEAAQVITYVSGRTPEKVDQLVRSRAVRYLGLFASAQEWAEHGVDHPLGADYTGPIDLFPHRYGREQVLRAIDAVPDELVRQRLLVGTPKIVLRKIRDLVNAGLRHAVLVPASALVSPADAAFGLGSALWMANRLRRG